eukprot:COSAG01_NODE_2934_length_6829_cov_7.598217_3_plen_108_part_00
MPQRAHGVGNMSIHWGSVAANISELSEPWGWPAEHVDHLPLLGGQLHQAIHDRNTTGMGPVDSTRQFVLGDGQFDFVLPNIFYRCVTVLLNIFQGCVAFNIEPWGTH